MQLRFDGWRLSELVRLSKIDYHAREDGYPSVSAIQPMQKLVLRKPPVIEAILAVQFVDLPWWSSLQHGLYYERIEQKYPKYAQTVELPAIVETFPAVPKVKLLQFSSEIDAGCANYRSEDESSLLRIQRNRFAYHWVQSSDGAYPHFSSNIEGFKSEFDRFETYCINSGTAVQPVLVEAVYVNRVEPRNNESLSQLMHSVFNVQIGDFELATLNRTFAIGKQGRLYAEINVDPREQIITLQLTSRRIYADPNVLESLTKAHDFLINIFVQLTTDEARLDRWQQQK